LKRGAGTNIFRYPPAVSIDLQRNGRPVCPEKLGFFVGEFTDNGKREDGHYRSVFGDDRTLIARVRADRGLRWRRPASRSATAARRTSDISRLLT
jgi:hypothetical protein